MRDVDATRGNERGDAGALGGKYVGEFFVFFGRQFPALFALEVAANFQPHSARQLVAAQVLIHFVVGRGSFQFSSHYTQAAKNGESFLLPRKISFSFLDLEQEVPTVQ